MTQPTVGEVLSESGVGNIAQDLKRLAGMEECVEKASRELNRVAFYLDSDKPEDQESVDYFLHHLSGADREELVNGIDRHTKTLATLKELIAPSKPRLL